MKLYIHFILMFVCFHSLILSQNNFVVFNSTNAPLPPNREVNIKQDKDGSYWICLPSYNYGGNSYPGGLAKFDGTNWYVYNHNNSPLSTRTVNSIAFDSLGRKWIATDSGLIKYDGINWSIYTKDNSPLRENTIWNVSVERDTIIWLCGYQTGFYRFDGINWTNYHRYNSPLLSDQANLVVIDNNGLKWFGSDYSPLFSYDGTSWQIYGKFPFAPGPGGFSNPDIRSFIIDKNNFKWITGRGYWGEGKPRYFAIAKFIDTIWTIYDSTIIGFQPYTNYFGIAIDSNNIKWFTDWKNGLISFNDTTFYLFNQTNSPIKFSYSIIVDKFNNKVFSAALNELLPTGENHWGVVFYNENGVILTSEKDKYITPYLFELSQNYPNPFNSRTTINLTLKDRSFTELKVFDVLGREIQTLVLKELDAGKHKVEFDGTSLPSGIYFYRLSSGGFIKIRKMILQK